MYFLSTFLWSIHSVQILLAPVTAGQTLIPPAELINRQQTNGERNNMTSESKCHEHRMKQSKEGGRDGLG